MARTPSSRKGNDTDNAIRRTIEAVVPGGIFIVLYVKNVASGLDVVSNIPAREVCDLLTHASKQIGLLNNTPNN